MKILPLLLSILTIPSFADTLYKAVLPDGRIIYTDSAYQQTHDTSKITVLDTIGAKNNVANGGANASLNSSVSTQANITTDAIKSQPASNSPMPILNAIPSSNTVTNSMANTTQNADGFVPLNISSTKATKAGDYQLTVQAPENDMVYHRPASLIQIKADVSPKPNAVDNVVFSIDGVEIGRNQTGNFTLPSYEVNAGEHTLTVSVNNVMNEAVASVTRKFYVIIQNPLIKQKRQLIAQMAAYEALPWYEKLAVHLGIANKDKKPTTTKELEKLNQQNADNKAKQGIL